MTIFQCSNISTNIIEISYINVASCCTEAPEITSLYQMAKENLKKNMFTLYKYVQNNEAYKNVSIIGHMWKSPIP